MDHNATLYHCPCYKSPADLVYETPTVTGSSKDNLLTTDRSEDDDVDAQLSLSDPRIQYSLFPLEELYFCDDCHVHRCPRCVTEEIVSVFCPNCLFEVPGKTNGTESHCLRNCFRCPCCQAATQTNGDELTGWKLECPYCRWSSLSTGLTFVRPTGLAGQISTQVSDARRDRYLASRKQLQQELYKDVVEQESAGARLYRQYKTAMADPQRAEIDSVESPSSSPPDLAHHDTTEDARVSHLMSLESLDSVVSITQRANQHFCPADSPTHRSPIITTTTTTSSLLPLPTPLRSKRTKRCRQCRLLLVKPDPKPLSIGFRSRLYARAVLVSLSLQPSPSPAVTPLQNAPSRTLVADTGADSGGRESGNRAQREPVRKWELTVTNPLPDPCRISLSTANFTPGGSRVTITCPDLLLGTRSSDSSWSTDATVLTRTGAATTTTTTTTTTRPTGVVDEGDGRSSSTSKGTTTGLNGGKLLRQGRNSGTVAVEVSAPPRTSDFEPLRSARTVKKDDDQDDHDHDDHDDALRIPMFVQMTWQADGDVDAADDSRAGERRRGAGGTGGKVERRLGFWVVLDTASAGRAHERR